MLFNSYQFILLFLPLVWCGYWYLTLKRKSLSQGFTFLTLASLGFYAHWEPIYLALLLASILFNYVVAGVTLGPHGRGWLIFGVCCNLLLLGFFKYSIFLMSDVAGLTDLPEWLSGLALPLGISFFTFHQITYLTDTYKRIVLRASFRDYMLYISFFPQLIAGPVVRAREFLPQLINYRGVRYFFRYGAIGLTLFVMGLAKKALVADHLADVANPLFQKVADGDVITFADSWVAALSYTFQLYFDFSGYSDMAIGLALMFGFKLPINFFSPYKSRSIADFWRRWHMTMSSFFRDYLYIPLGGSRGSKPRTIINLLLTMSLVGLWHGAGWTFIIWGALHGAYLSLHRLYRWTIGDRLAVCLDKSRLYSVAAHSLTFLAVIVAWAIFRSASWSEAQSILQSMFGFNGIVVPNKVYAAIPFLQEQLIPMSDGQKWLTAPLWSFAAIVAAYAACLILPSSMSYTRLAMQEGPWKLRFRPSRMVTVAVAMLLVAVLLSLHRISEFLYFQF
jgi:alginate O-acetyltransferase complex protein AlgI